LEEWTLVAWTRRHKKEYLRRIRSANSAEKP
jgi:hypothetical protein